MDTFGKVMLGITIAVVTGAAAGFWYLSRHGPKGAALALAAVVYFASFAVVPDGSRALYGVIGILRLSGFVGALLGAVDLMRRRGPRDQTPSRGA